jgi:DNA-directed RNA polymerase specialized sigma24 family protein
VVAWCRTVIERIEASRHRRESRERPVGDVSALEDVQTEASKPEGDLGDPPRPRSVTDLDLSGLTDRQARAVLAYAGAPSLRAACRELGVEWRTFRDLVERAVRSLTSGPRLRAAEDRSWGVEFAWHLEEAGHDIDAAVLRQWVLERTAREIGASLTPPLSPEAVRSRLQRIRGLRRERENRKNA